MFSVEAIDNPCTKEPRIASASLRQLSALLPTEYSFPDVLPASHINLNGSLPAAPRQQRRPSTAASSARAGAAAAADRDSSDDEHVGSGDTGAGAFAQAGGSRSRPAPRAVATAATAKAAAQEQQREAEAAVGVERNLSDDDRNARPRC
eukprot:2003775-Pleurochrysis_carterae.AAC.2